MTKYRLTALHALPAFFTLLAFLTPLAACHRSEAAWQDRDKWMLTYHMTRMTLRNHPKQVTEYIYDAQDTVNPEVRKKFYTRYGFDSDGNVISRNVYESDTLWMKFDYWIDRGGEQDSVITISTAQVSHGVSSRLSDGRYMSISPHLGGRPTASIVRFISGGDETIREYYADSAAHGNPTEILHFYYKGNRLLRITGHSAKGPEEYLYFYSTFDAPDSIQYYGRGSAERMLGQRQLFFHNDHGDVAREIVIRGNDTTRFEDNSYSYDEKGNWIRRIIFPRKFEPTNYHDKVVSVIDREIVY